MILESVEHGALIWPTIEENGATGTKKYEELYATEKLQADCDLKATNIILQGLPTDVYSLVNLHRVKEYEELSATEKIQADCDLKATNIILQELPSDVYSLVNHHRVAQNLRERVQLLMQGVTATKFSLDFGKRFVPQQELSDEQAYWLQTSHPSTDQSASSPVKIEAPQELPKIILVNTILKKLKYHLGQFNSVVTKQTTTDALIEEK
nr:hypothetical protein [Tanacetum cinerariifolium]